MVTMVAHKLAVAATAQPTSTTAAAATPPSTQANPSSYVSHAEGGKYSTWNTAWKLPTAGQGIITFDIQGAVPGQTAALSVGQGVEANMAMSSEQPVSAFDNNLQLYELVFAGWANHISAIGRYTQQYNQSAPYYSQIANTVDYQADTKVASHCILTVNSATKTIGFNVNGYEKIACYDPNFLSNVQYWAGSSNKLQVTYSNINIYPLASAGSISTRGPLLNYRSIVSINYQNQQGGGDMQLCWAAAVAGAATTTAAPAAQIAVGPTGGAGTTNGSEFIMLVNPSNFWDNSPIAYGAPVMIISFYVVPGTATTTATGPSTTGVTVYPKIWTANTSNTTAASFPIQTVDQTDASVGSANTVFTINSIHGFTGTAHQGDAVFVTANAALSASTVTNKPRIVWNYSTAATASGQLFAGDATTPTSRELSNGVAMISEEAVTTANQTAFNAIMQSSLFNLPVNVSSDYVEETGVATAIAVGSIMQSNNVPRLVVSALNSSTPNVIYTYDANSLGATPWGMLDAVDDKGNEIAFITNIAVACDGSEYIVDNTGNVYRFNWDKNNFTKISAGTANTGLAITKVAVGSSSSLWAIDSKKNAYQYNFTTQAWEIRVGSDSQGDVLDISVAIDGTVAIVNARNTISTYAGSNQWQTLGGTHVKNVAAVSADLIYFTQLSGLSSIQLWQYSKGTASAVADAKGNPITGFVTIAATSGAFFGLDTKGDIYNKGSSAVKVVQAAATAAKSTTTAKGGTTAATSAATAAQPKITAQVVAPTTTTRYQAKVNGTLPATKTPAQILAEQVASQNAQKTVVAKKQTKAAPVQTSPYTAPAAGGVIAHATAASVLVKAPTAAPKPAAPAAKAPAAGISPAAALAGH